MLGKEARDGAVGNHSPASADYSLRRKMRFLSHRNSVIKIKYNVWLDSAKWTSAGACVHFTEMPDKKHDLKQCASSKSEEVGGGRLQEGSVHFSAKTLLALLALHMMQVSLVIVKIICGCTDLFKRLRERKGKKRMRFMESQRVNTTERLN